MFKKISTRVVLGAPGLVECRRVRNRGCRFFPGPLDGKCVNTTRKSLVLRKLAGCAHMFTCCFMGTIFEDNIVKQQQPQLNFIMYYLLMMQDPKEETRKPEYVQEFSVLLDRIMRSEWKKALNQALKAYNIKLYNIEKLSPKKVRDLYLHLSQRFYVIDQQNEIWHENELRLFIWILVTYSYLLKKPIPQFTVEHWEYLSKLFHGKNPLLCQFQFMNIRKAALKNQTWMAEEDELLTYVIKSQTEKNRWNEVAKLVFYESGRKYFRTAKQCRERWNNYLDPSKTRGSWSGSEDFILVSCVLKDGKKWAQIAKLLQGRRTEHMVKNRYKSLLTRYSKHFRDKPLATEADILTFILERVGEEASSSAEYSKLQEPVKLEESESDNPTVPQQASNMCSSIQSTHQADFDADLPKFGGSPLIPTLLCDLESDHANYLGVNELQFIEDRSEVLDRGLYGRLSVNYFDDDHDFI